MGVTADEAADERWMRRALSLADRACAMQEVPVGAVLVEGNKEIGVGWNGPIHSHDPSAHAEIVALRAAASALGNYRLPGTSLYVTLEPCVMCAGAISHARVARVVFGAFDPKAGACGSVIDVFATARLNHRPVVTGGVMADAARDKLTGFFAARR